MEEKETDHYLQAYPFYTQSQPQGERRHPFLIKLSWLRSPLVGYCVCPLLTALALLAQLAFQRFGLGSYAATTGFYLSTVIVAYLWGIGPALLAIVLGYVALESLVVPPHGIFTFNGWSDVMLYVPFIVSQLLVVMLTVQREKARRAAQIRAQEQALVNCALVNSNHQLERANQLKDLFLSEASHELKNPVTVILGRTHLILRHLTRSRQAAPELPSLQSSLEKIEAQTCRLQALIDDFFDVSSLHAGKAPLRFAPCDLSALCQEAVEEQRLLSDRSIDLDLPPAPILLQADRQRLTQVVVNLVSNAIKYSPANTPILVTAQERSPHVLLAVHNEGPAIPPERQTAIFEPFYRAPEAEQSSTRGWGLGLPISKAIVEQHKGTIWVESAEGKGTTFFVQLAKETA